LAQKLQRNLSLPGAVATIIGMVVGPSLFVLLPTVAGMTGPSLWIASAVASIPAIFCVLYVVQLGSAVPVTGCHYVAITRWLSPLAGWIVSLCSTIAIVASNCLLAWGFAVYIDYYVPGVPLLIWALLIVVIFGLINYLGIKLVGWSQIVMVIIFIAAILLFSIGGAMNANPEFLKPLFPKGIEGFIMGCVVLSFLWLGFVASIEFSGEIINPRKNIPRAIIISFLFILTIFLLQPFALVATMLWSQAGELGELGILEAASRFLPAGAVMFVALGAIMAMMSSINALILVAAREITAWGRDGMLPKIFSRVNKRFSTPEVALLSTTILTLIGILFAVTLDKYATIAVLALMIIQILGSTVTWLLPKRAPKISEKSIFKFSPFWRWFIWISCLVLFGSIFIIALISDITLGLIFGGMLAIGLIYWFARKAYLKGRGIDLDKELGRIAGPVLEELEDRSDPLPKN